MGLYVKYMSRKKKLVPAVPGFCEQLPAVDADNHLETVYAFTFALPRRF